GRSPAYGIAELRREASKIAPATTPADFTAVDWASLPPAAEAMDRLGRSVVDVATVRGNRFELFSDTGAILAAIARDVDAATTSVLMEFYIWNEGGLADEVVEAVIRAARRGVQCRLLVDGL